MSTKETTGGKLKTYAQVLDKKSGYVVEDALGNAVWFPDETPREEAIEAAVDHLDSHYRGTKPQTDRVDREANS